MVWTRDGIRRPAFFCAAQNGEATPHACAQMRIDLI